METTHPSFPTLSSLQAENSRPKNSMNVRPVNVNCRAMIRNWNLFPLGALECNGLVSSVDTNFRFARDPDTNTLQRGNSALTLTFKKRNRVLKFRADNNLQINALSGHLAQ